MSEKTAIGFLDQLRESGVASAQAVDEIAAQGPFEHEKVPARLALEKGLITLWQAKRLLSGNSQLKLGNYLLVDRLPAPTGRNLFLAKSLADAKTYWVEWEAPASACSVELTEAAKADSGWAIHPIHVETLGPGQAIVYPVFGGKPLFGDKKQAVRLDRPQLARALRAIASGLQELHAQGKSWGRMHPSQVVQTKDSFRLGRWASWSGQQLADDPFIDETLLSAEGQGVDSDLVALGRIGLYLGFGTKTPKKVQPKSRLDRLLIRLAANDAERPQSAAEVVAAIDEWQASKTEAAEPPLVAESNESVADVESEADDASSAQSELPDVIGAANAPVEGMPAIDTHTESGPIVVDAAKLAVESPEFRERNMVLAYAVYIVLSLVILTTTIVAVVVVVRIQNQPEVAQNEPATEDTSDAAADAEPNGAGVLPVVPVVDNDPAPLIDLNLPEEVGIEGPGAGDLPPGPDAGAPGVVDAGDPAEPMEVNPDEADPVGPETVADTDPMPADPATTEPDDTPYVPAFRDLPAFADLPVVGEEEWQKEIVLGSLHLQPGDLLFMELKGSSKAFRENTNFEVSNADGGTAQYAFDIVAIVGGDRTRVARIDAEGGVMKFRYYDEAADVASANYLRNCYLRMRTGTDVGGLALRKPIELTPLSLDDRRVQAQSDTRIDFVPDTSALKVRMLPLGDTFPDYAFKNNQSVASASRGSIDIIFGGKYAEAMFLRMESLLRNRLTLKVSSFAIVERRARPFRSEEVEKTLADATVIRDVRAAQIKQLDAIPREQRPPQFNQQRQLAEVERKQAEALVKQCDDSLKFVDSMKGQQLPVAVYFEADEFKVYLATPDGKPIDQ